MKYLQVETISHKNVWGNSIGRNFQRRGYCPEGNYLEIIVWRQLSSGELSRASCSGVISSDGNCPGGSCPGRSCLGVILWGANVWRVIVLRGISWAMIVRGAVVQGEISGYHSKHSTVKTKEIET